MAPHVGAVEAGDSPPTGRRLTFNSGAVLHLRPSGNAPELRCYTESDAKALALSLCDACLSQVAQHLNGLQ